MAEAVVEHADKIEVDHSIQGDAVILVLKVDPADLGKVIGRYGRTARSIRTILGAASMKAQHRFSLEIRAINSIQPDGADLPSQ